MWTLSEPYGAKNWWPCKQSLTDKIDSLDMFVTTPVKYITGSNGILKGRDTIANGTKVITHWKHRYPIAAYLVAFASSEYSIYEDTINLIDGKKLMFLNYVFPCDSAYAHSQTKKMDTAMNFFISKFGSYPYEKEKYGHAQCMFWGGMEHTTMTFIGGWWYYIMIHELAHQWFGDKITCGSWHDIWLNEGFATYLEGLTCENGIQTKSFHDWLKGKHDNVLSNKYGSVYCDDTTNVSRIFSSRLSYNKGAYLLHMLRWILGDTAFFKGMHNYINDTSLTYDYALTADFKNHMESAGDTLLTEFFNDWYYDEGWPDFSIKWTVDTGCNNKLRVVILQSHSANQGTFFEIPVPIKFFNNNKDTTLVFNQNTPSDTLFFANTDFVPDDAQFDPQLWLCAKATITKQKLSFKSIHWTGNINNFWNNSENWDCGKPSENDEVIIQNNTPECIINVDSTGSCKTLILESNAEIKTLQNAKLNIMSINKKRK
jgi:aminopeptidase N